MASTNNNTPLRALVLAPIGRDGQLICSVLSESQITALQVNSMETLCEGIGAGTGVAVLTDETLTATGTAFLVQALTRQPAWSDLPLIVLASRAETGARADTAVRIDTAMADAMRPLGHVVILERPLRIATLISAVRAALRSRKRQYEMRNHLKELRIAEQEIRRTNEHLQLARDEAMQANKAKSIFLANMSHELRTPLNAIIGYAEMLVEELEENDQRTMAEDAEKIRFAGKHLLSVISDILDLSKIEAGRLELHLEMFDIGELLQETVTVVKPMAEKTSNTIRLNCNVGAHNVWADRTRLAQIVFNLLSNAAKFTEDGTIELTCSHCPDRSGWIEIRVKDSGIGMTEQQLGRLFEKFQQFDTDASRRFGGTGLGLYISRALCRMMGGDIQVKSEPGHGTEFTMHLPTLQSMLNHNHAGGITMRSLLN